MINSATTTMQIANDMIKPRARAAGLNVNVADPAHSVAVALRGHAGFSPGRNYLHGVLAAEQKPDQPACNMAPYSMTIDEQSSSSHDLPTGAGTMKKLSPFKRNLLVMGIAGAVAAGASGVASAATYSYFLTTSNNQNWTQGDSFAEVTLTDVGNDILFSVNLCEPSSDDTACTGGVTSDELNAAGPNQHTLEQFGFNTLLELTPANISGLPDGWDLGSSDTMAVFGKFSYSVKAGGNGDTVEPLSFTIMYAGDSISDYTSLMSSKGHLFAGKVSATGSGAFISDEATPSEVPLPGTLGLLGIGLAGLGLVRRKQAA